MMRTVCILIEGYPAKRTGAISVVGLRSVQDRKDRFINMFRVWN
jgi:hypothetical protein